MTNARETLWSLGIEIDNGPNGDAWGSSIGALFDIAHAIEHYGKDYPPVDWEYRDSLGCTGLLPSRESRFTGQDEDARVLAAAILRGCEQSITHVGDVLHRYLRVLERAGKSY